MRRWWLILCVVLALVASACSGGDDDDATDDGDDSGETTAGGDGEGWTILAYSMADTNLEPYMVTDVNEMGNVGTTGGVTIRALVDRHAEYGEDDLLDQGAWVGAKVLEINQGSAEVLEDLGDLNLADPDTLSTFLSEGIEANPGTKYALIISDHGAGWPGIGPDEGSGEDTLTLEELESSISEGLEDAGVDKLDLLGFDACLMATYEVASVMAPLADRMIASAELEPGHGWDYNALQAAADDPDLSVDDLGIALIDGFQGQAAESNTGADITLSMVDLTQMDAVDEAMASFSASLVERSAEVSPTIGRARPRNLSYGRSPDPSQDTWMTDLGALAAAIGIDALDVSDEADALQRALNDAVVHKIEGPLAADFSGLSIYFPPGDFFNPEYADIPENAGGWLDFLQAYYGAGDAIPEEERPQFETDEATISFDEDGLTIEGIFDIAAQDNLAEAAISYGIVNEDGSITFIGEETASVSDDGSGLASGFYDLTVLTLSDGEDTTFAYLALESDEESDGFTIDVPMAYYAPGDEEGETYQDVLLSLVVDGEGNITQETYYAYDDDAGTYGEATLDPEGIIVPEVLTVDDEGNGSWEPTTDVGLFADLPNLLYDLEALESGTQLYIELTVTDFGGNSDSVAAIVTIP